MNEAYGTCVHDKYFVDHNYYDDADDKTDDDSDDGTYLRRLLTGSPT